VEGSCEWGNETEVSTKCSKCIEYLRDLELLKKYLAVWSVSQSNGTRRALHFNTVE
jgi:hypothetical protein